MLCAASPTPTSQLFGLLLIVLAGYAVYRRLEVRLTLLLAALAIAALAGNVWVVIHKFFGTFADEKFVVPICTAMGFAYVLRHTGCDQHLVRLLVKPLTRVRWLLLPGTVVVGFLINMPIVSQTSTAVTIGPVVIPILLAARFSPLTTGAALLLGTSIGGELFNPGAPELRTVIVESRNAGRQLGVPFEQYDTERCVQRILPLNLLGLGVATGLFWLLSSRVRRAVSDESKNSTQADVAGAEVLRSPGMGHTGASEYLSPGHAWENLVKAMVPLVPLVFLYAAAPPLQLIEVPHGWLEPLTKEMAPPGRFESRLIGLAMLIGSAIAGLVVWRRGLDTAKVFFEGAGYGFTHIISLIVTANCFGSAIQELHLTDAFSTLIQDNAALLILAAGLVSFAFAFLCGSGMAATQSLFVLFAGPALRSGIDPTQVGAVVALAAAAGRTLSPVSAVNLMTARLTDTTSFELTRRLAVPLLAAVFAIILTAMLWQPGP